MRIPEICAVHGRPYETYRQMANGLLAPHCTWDGSLHPDVFMDWLEKPGTSLVPTDKNSKVYIRVKNGEPNPGEERIVSMVTFELEAERIEAEHWLPANHPRVQAALERDGGWRGSDYTYAQLIPRGADCEDKFYFEHLSDEQRTRFLELLNAGRIALEYPGYFYRLPFFLTRASA